MKYFLDTEFIEGSQKKTIFGLPVGNTKPTIDLISIGIVSEDGREYYAISKDFNLKEAWNRYDLQDVKYGCTPSKGKEKVYWIRENVLKPIFYDFMGKDINFHSIDSLFTYKNFKRLLSLYGKTNKEISEGVHQFCRQGENKIRYHNNPLESYDYKCPGSEFYYAKMTHQEYSPEFYTYYGAYDWVVLCWLFGKMINLPKGFPMYTHDLKQLIDEKAEEILANKLEEQKDNDLLDFIPTVEGVLKTFIKSRNNYPKQENEHNALGDARWNKYLFDFISSLK